MDAPLLFPADGSAKRTNKYRVAPAAVPETLMKTRTSADVASLTCYIVDVHLRAACCAPMPFAEAEHCGCLLSFPHSHVSRRRGLSSHDACSSTDHTSPSNPTPRPTFSTSNVLYVDYPMLVMKVQTMLNLERLLPHQRMLREKLLIPYDKVKMAGRVLFISRKSVVMGNAPHYTRHTMSTHLQPAQTVRCLRVL